MLSTDLEKELKILEFILWLSYYCLSCLSVFFVHFLNFSDQIHSETQERPRSLKLFYKQEAGDTGGGGGGRSVTWKTSKAFRTMLY